MKNKTVSKAHNALVAEADYLLQEGVLLESLTEQDMKAAFKGDCDLEKFMYTTESRSLLCTFNEETLPKMKELFRFPLFIR